MQNTLVVGAGKNNKTKGRNEKGKNPLKHCHLFWSLKILQNDIRK